MISDESLEELAKGCGNKDCTCARDNLYQAIRQERADKKELVYEISKIRRATDDIPEFVIINRMARAALEKVNGR